MTRTLMVAIALHAAVAVGRAAAQSHEVVLNYSDPHGADLVLTLAPHIEDFPDWMRRIGSAETSGKRNVALTMQRGRAGAASSRYSLSVPSLSPGVRAASGAAPAFKLDSAIGASVELRGTAGKPNPGEASGKASGKPGSTSGERALSDSAARVVLLLAKSAATNQESLRALVERKNLVFDGRFARRVVTNFDPTGDINHVDFIGILRAKQENLQPPDATSSNILSLYKDGHYEIVRREQDTPTDLRNVKFGFEESK